MCGGVENSPKSAEEPAVRPKVRNVATTNCMKPKILFDIDDDDVPQSISRWRDAADADADKAHAEGLPRRAQGECAGSSSESKYSEDKKDNRNGQVKPEKVSRWRCTMADSDFWSYTDDYYRYYEEVSDSDKEWMAALSQKYRRREQLQSSSGESWEPLPVKEEPEPQQARKSVNASGAGSLASTSVGSNGSGYPEEVQDPSLQEEEQASQEGKIPWLRYNDNESSSEGDNKSGHEMMQPGMFMLDGNNNLEDDSSVSEDLEVDWSLFDGFADGLGVAEAISYVDPQFLTYMVSKSAWPRRWRLLLRTWSLSRWLTHQQARRALMHFLRSWSLKIMV
ncbi:E3 ubiquitin-protein ligase [Cricetulus griseus]|nr:E3 ubiquitin-protein ligase [Cricetulus griseus]